MEIVTITEARRRLDGALPSYEAKIEYVTPNQALGRITARDITAACDYPPYRKSPFDGYAIHIAMTEMPMKSWRPSAPASSMTALLQPARPYAS
jgi:molybdopterin biosynthesis enzyme